MGSHAVGLDTMSGDPGELFIKAWMYSCMCCQVDIFEWTGQHQINGAPPCGNPIDVSSLYNHSMIPYLTAAWATGENFLAVPFPEFVAFCDDSSGELVMLTGNLPWDPGTSQESSPM